MSQKEYKIQVIHSDGDKEDFKPRVIGNTILKETNIDEDLAKRIQNRVAAQIHKLGLDEISTSMIRSQVSSQLLKEGEIRDAENSMKLGMSVSEFENLINNGCKDNANISYSPEMIAKYAYDSIAKEYALLTMPQDCAQAHKDGLIHIHDLEYYNTRPNCLNYDLRFFARNGLKIDGAGLMGSVAKPAKSLEVLLNHMLQAWMAGATTMSGGQGYANFNTLLAPFCRGRSYDDIKQAIQGFIFNCNMSLICRGGQVLFSSIALDLSTPDVLANEPAIGPGGVAMGVYRDYKEEADLIFKAVCEVLNEKDGAGAYHRFPNCLFNIREGDLDKFEGNCKLLHELGANNPTIYYNNCVELERSTMGCRSSLPMNYSGDYAKDCLNTGNFMYNTINLHLLALESKNIDEFYTLLDNVCELCYKSLLHRREVVIDAVYNKHMSDFLIQKDKETGEPLWDIDRTTITLGYCGLNECLETLYGKDEGTFNDQDKHGVDIISFINHKKEEFYKRDGLRWSVIASPAESTATRFAEINKSKYPYCNVQGKKDGYYLTNSHHIPVSSEVDLITHIKNAGDYHPISLGGAILHLFMGEIWTDPRSLWKFNQKIIDSGAIFWAYSKVFTYCAECGFTINDDINVCPICGSTHLRKHERITGYYLCVATFNPGKTQEVNDRHRHEFDSYV